MSYILTQVLAKRAVNLVAPTINKLLGSELTGGRPNLAIAVLDPLNGNILYEESFGIVADWPRDYAEIARSKADVAYRTGTSVRTVRTDAPWLYQAGDTRYVGGVYENGLAIGASGLQDHFDEMIAWLVLAAIQGLCRHAVTQIPDDAPDFFGG